MAQVNNIVSSITRLPLGIFKFTKEARDELKKVSWPSRQTTIRYTVIVITASVVVGIIIGGIDYLLTLLLEGVL